MKLFMSLSKSTKIVVAATLLCYIVTVVMVANAVKFRTQPKVTVRATVSDIEEVDTSTADEPASWSYRYYIDYHYLGKNYERVYFIEDTDGAKYSIGDTVEAEVYKEQPDTVANDTAVNFVFFIGFSVILTVISVGLVKKEKGSVKVPIVKNDVNGDE